MHEIDRLSDTLYLLKVKDHKGRIIDVVSGSKHQVYNESMKRFEPEPEPELNTVQCSVCYRNEPIEHLEKCPNSYCPHRQKLLL